MFFIFHKEWDDFFSSPNRLSKYVSLIDRFEIFTSSNSYYLSQSYFANLSSEGAVRLAVSGDNKILVDTTSFEDCGHENGLGGSLYIRALHGECVQDRICSFGSKTPNNQSAYCYSIVDSSSTSKNYLLDSTITSSEGLYTNLYLMNGNTYMKSINISNSKMNYKNLYEVNFNSNSNVTYSTFTNHTSTGASQAYHKGLSDSLEFKILFCNYIKNSGNTLISSEYNLNIFNCSFDQNNISKYFVAIRPNTEIQVKRCYIDISDPGKYGSVTITDNVDSKYPKNRHLSTGLCFEDIPFIIESEVKIKTVYNRKRKFKILIFIFTRILK